MDNRLIFLYNLIFDQAIPERDLIRLLIPPSAGEKEESCRLKVALAQG